MPAATSPIIRRFDWKGLWEQTISPLIHPCGLEAPEQLAGGVSGVFKKPSRKVRVLSTECMEHVVKSEIIDVKVSLAQYLNPSFAFELVLLLNKKSKFFVLILRS